MESQEFKLKSKKYYLYLLAMLCCIYKNGKMNITKSNYKKIKKISRQQKEEYFNFIVFENSTVKFTNKKKPKRYICEFVNNPNTIELLEEYLPEELIIEVKNQISEYKL